MQLETFQLRSEVIDLLQLLKATGHAGTGGEAKALVEQEFVTVNDQLETRKRRKLKAGDVIVLADQVQITLV